MKSTSTHPDNISNPAVLRQIVARIKSGKIKRIVVAVGAGISVSAGVPDFRTPGTGIYSKLKSTGLPCPEAVFDLSYFKKSAKPFCSLAKVLFPGNFAPTKTHFFSVLLEKKGLLLRHYTQNIDTLERQTGISDDMLVEAHGSFRDVFCIDCGAGHSLEKYKQAIFDDVIPTCELRYLDPSLDLKPDSSTLSNSDEGVEALIQNLAGLTTSANLDTRNDKSVPKENPDKCLVEESNTKKGEPGQKTKIEKNSEVTSAYEKLSECGGLLKPDICFFGESLPERFYDMSLVDLPRADLLIIMGTSLKVMPFAGMIQQCSSSCYRLLINREPVGLGTASGTGIESETEFDTDSDSDEDSYLSDPSCLPSNSRDVFIRGECDDGVEQFCKMLGWENELNEIFASSRACSEKATGGAF